MGLEQIIPGRLLAWYAGTDEDEPAITGDVPNDWTKLADDYIEPGGITMEYQDDLEPIDLLKDMAPAAMRQRAGAGSGPVHHHGYAPGHAGAVHERQHHHGHGRREWHQCRASGDEHHARQ